MFPVYTVGLPSGRLVYLAVGLKLLAKSPQLFLSLIARCFLHLRSTRCSPIVGTSVKELSLPLTPLWGGGNRETISVQLQGAFRRSDLYLTPGHMATSSPALIGYKVLNAVIGQIIDVYFNDTEVAQPSQSVPTSRSSSYRGAAGV